MWKVILRKVGKLLLQTVNLLAALLKIEFSESSLIFLSSSFIVDMS